MNVIDTYDKEFKILLEQAIANAARGQTTLVANQLGRELEELEEIMEQMELEVMSLDLIEKTRYQSKLREYRDQLKKLKKSPPPVQSERDQLLGSQDQRSRLLDGTERLEEGSNRLNEAHRIALETEQIGINTLGDLHRQRQQIERTRDGVSSINAARASRFVDCQKSGRLKDNAKALGGE
jgi:vesicle transport through interaction with t-SNAREs protein 1